MEYTGNGCYNESIKAAIVPMKGAAMRYFFKKSGRRRFPVFYYGSDNGVVRPS